VIEIKLTKKWFTDTSPPERKKLGKSNIVEMMEKEGAEYVE